MPTLTLLSTDAFTWTSAASPGPAPSRNEAFRFSSWKRKFGDSFFCLSKCFCWDVTTREAGGRGKVFTAHLFQEVPGFLCEVRWKAEFAFQDFVNGLLSVFTSEWRLWKSQKQWLALLANASYLNLPFDACSAVRNAIRLQWDRLVCTYCSCQHVIHESSQTPPVHCSVMSTPHQYLWSPEVGEGNGRHDIADTLHRVRSRKCDWTCRCLQHWNMN